MNFTEAKQVSLSKKYLGNFISSNLNFRYLPMRNNVLLILFVETVQFIPKLKTSKLYKPRKNIFFKNIPSISILAHKLINLKNFPSET